MLADKRAVFEAALAADDAELRAERAEAERQLCVIEDERRRLLAEAAALAQHLPKFVARDRGELEYINALSAQMGGMGMR